jgi:single-stranded-DNA-specific exonuclease
MAVNNLSENERPIPEVVKDILTARGMAPEQIWNFLYPDYDEGLHDPFLMSDMGLAVERIRLAIERSERVVVYGDYDIDGITASAVLIECLNATGLEVSSYIPDRFEEGYGINQAALEQLQREGAQLVISVDCGITSVDEAAWAHENGLDLIITDHHAVPDILPQAIAVLNPKRPDDSYPFKELAGVGVAFKLVQALKFSLGLLPNGQEKWLLDLVAMGTICDVVPLIDENRVLASYGLRVLSRTRRVGIRALGEVGGVNLDNITAYDVGYVLGPRMNAAGRLEHASRSLELVLTTDKIRAVEIARELEMLNQQRRADQAKILAKAEAMANDYEDDNVIVLVDSEWSHGVVGIVASKLAEKRHKPVLLAQLLGETIKGSARSVPGYNMVEALRSKAQLLTRFGGHFYAAGYTLPLANLGSLRTALNDYYVQNMAVNSAVDIKAHLDLSWQDISRLNMDLIKQLSLLEPHGNANPRPHVSLIGLEVIQVRRVGSDRQHLSLQLRDTAGRKIKAIGFNLAEKYLDIAEGAKVTVTGSLSKNEFQGKATIQMVLSEIDYE